MIAIHYIVLGIALLLLISVFASKMSERLGVPALLLFLAVGMLAGSEGIGKVDFENAYAAKMLGSIALVLILFAGGLDTNWKSIRPVIWSGMTLATLGVFLTAIIVGIFAIKVLKFSVMEGLLLGAVVSSTDAAAVFSILRSKNVSLKGRTKALLEMESGSNDPMSIFLTVGILYLIKNPAVSWLVMIPMLGQQLAVGTAMGWLFGKGAVHLVNRLKLEYEGLYPVLTLSAVLAAFGASEAFGGNGFLAVYLAGIIMGNSDFLHKNSLKRFHDGIAWLMQIGMFLTLGLLVLPSHVVPVWRNGIMLAAFLMFAARPVSVFISLAFSKISLREKILVSWVGLRGAAPIVLATFPLLAGVPEANMIFNLVFFIVVASVILQGKSLLLVAKWLKLTRPHRAQPRYPLEFERSEKMSADMREIEISPESSVVGKRILDLKLPTGTLVVLVCKKGEFHIPTGGTILSANDKMLVLAEHKKLKAVEELLSEN